MNDALPASAATSARFVMAGLALSPFLPKLSPSLRLQGLLCGSFTALGYISQSISLETEPSATVAFLGALTVVWCPLLAAVVDRKPLGFADAPQTWLAAALALLGVGVLELAGTGDTAFASVGWGDLWAVLQAVDFGTSFFITEKMMQKEPSQALPITAIQCGVVAVYSAAWATADGLGLGPFAAYDSAGWLLDESRRAVCSLPGLISAGIDGPMRAVAAAAAWTGLITTAANRLGETLALGKMASSEASVLLATEPIWAAAFAAALLGEAIGANDVAGGALIVLGCVCNAVDPQRIRELLGMPAAAATETGSAAAEASAEASAPGS